MKWCFKSKMIMISIQFLWKITISMNRYRFEPLPYLHVGRLSAAGVPKDRIYRKARQENLTLGMQDRLRGNCPSFYLRDLLGRNDHPTSHSSSSSKSPHDWRMSGLERTAQKAVDKPPRKSLGTSKSLLQGYPFTD